jgi:uncharacterized protein
MKLREYQVLLSSSLDNTRSNAPDKTALGCTAAEGLEMARAYLCDGTTFFTRDDPVNSVASIFYAFGWLHFGCAYGALRTEMKITPCPFISPCERFPDRAWGKLAEKTERYKRLLNTARGAVTCAPDPTTPAYLLAVRVLQVAEIYADQGKLLQQEKRHEDALAAFSYGHGWLDAGVRAGLFVIVAERELFTV